MRHFNLAFATTLTAALLSACGGGGSSNNGPAIGSPVTGSTPAQYAGHYERPCTAASVNGAAVNVWQKNTLDLIESGGQLTSVSRTSVYDDNACTSRVATLVYPTYTIALDGAVRLSTNDVADRATQKPTAPLQISSENPLPAKATVTRTGNKVTVEVLTVQPRTTLPEIEDPSGQPAKSLMRLEGHNLFLISSPDGASDYPSTLSGAQVWAKQ